MKNLKKLTYTIIGIALISLFTTSSSFAEAPDVTDVKDVQHNCQID